MDEADVIKIVKETGDDIWVRKDTLVWRHIPVLITGITVVLSGYFFVNNLQLNAHERAKHAQAASKNEVDLLKEQFKELKTDLRTINSLLNSLLRGDVSMSQKVEINTEDKDPLASYLTAKMRQIRQEKENEFSEKSSVGVDSIKVQTSKTIRNGDREVSRKDS